ncbi:unnamed protein product [Diadromus pulchellus idnoreovirus 1]|uniref:Uncharacterized protein S7 n=1 Tax=Diadromus pulchellus idnoreovirus 1 TaxID=37368 RepID=S7_DPIRV|nr:unnamed protein product [Diadromus pulchellus idnoreovirus 1]Q86285.1 RecName: Full=Uncharacterized protein S7 [Diadromus pulchellus idnoreovirus 1]CAA57564.1 unnamed protein product [Diadromus pulchellus idnoreovirus 1]
MNNDPDSEAVTITIDKTEIEKLVNLLTKGRLSSYRLTQTVTQMLDEKLNTGNGGYVSLNRREVTSMSMMRTKLEQLQRTTNKNALLGRMVFLSIANSEFVSEPNQEYMTSMIALLDKKANGIGTELFRVVRDMSPAEIGLKGAGQNYKSATISLESKAPIRQMMQNQYQDKVIDEAIDIIDGFCSSDLAIQPLCQTKILQSLAQYKYLVNEFGTTMPTYSDGTKDITVKEESAITEAEWKALDLDKPLLEQDFSYAKTTRTDIVITPWSNHTGIEFKSEETYIGRNSGIEIDGVRLKLKLGGLKKIWTSVKNFFQTNKPMIKVLLHEGLKIAKPYLSPVSKKSCRECYRIPRNWTSSIYFNNSGDGTIAKDSKATVLKILPQLARLGKLNLSTNEISTDNTRVGLSDYNDEAISQIKVLGRAMDMSPTTIIRFNKR